MSHPVGSRRRLVLRRWVPHVLFAAACLLTVAATWYVSLTAKERVRAEFLADADGARHQIQVRLNAHIDVVRASAALLAASPETSPAEFRAFVARLQLRQRYPGIARLGFVERVRLPNLGVFYRALYLDGVARFRIRPPGQRAEYHPVVFIEPGDAPNRSAIGFDFSSHSLLHAAMERARDTAQPTMTAKLDGEHVVDDGRWGSVVLVVPIYRARLPLSSVEERQQALHGFVFGAFDADYLLRTAVGSVDVDVYDDTREDPVALLTRHATGAAEDRLESAVAMPVAGRDWLVVVRSRQRLPFLTDNARATLLGGLLLAVLLFAITRAQVHAWETTARHEAELLATAQHDSLTSLPNRALLADHLTRSIAVARRGSHRVAILFMDLDRFKHINDSLGHAIGDRLLQSVAVRLLTCVRSSDTVSRHGGDEFVLLLSHIEHSNDVVARTQGMIGALASPHSVGQHDIHVTASIGVSLFPDDGEDAETLLKAADTAMYQAKERGRNNFQFFRRDMNERAVERQSIEAGLRRALVRHEFVLHYQPKINLQTGAVAGAEALIRWMRPDRGLVGPKDFVPVAEDSGLIVPIGRWVLREACMQARAWIDSGLPIVVAVNISPVELRDKDFLDGVRAILHESGLEPRYLELELTESVLMHHAEPTVAVLQTLKDLGVTIAVDDFGTGYSSLSYLRQFPIDVLKIDQSFVHEITSPIDHAPIVGAIISMGKSLRHRVTAEGVETREQLAFLQAQHCTEGQGFLFSRPVIAAHFITLL